MTQLIYGGIWMHLYTLTLYSCGQWVLLSEAETGLEFTGNETNLLHLQGLDPDLAFPKLSGYYIFLCVNDVCCDLGVWNW